MFFLELMVGKGFMFTKDYYEILWRSIKIVDFPIKNGGSFHSFLYVHQRVKKNH